MTLARALSDQRQVRPNLRRQIGSRRRISEKPEIACNGLFSPCAMPYSSTPDRRQALLPNHLLPQRLDAFVARRSRSTIPERICTCSSPGRRADRRRRRQSPTRRGPPPPSRRSAGSHRRMNTAWRSSSTIVATPEIRIVAGTRHRRVQAK
jgi:hypothetical protein